MYSTLCYPGDVTSARVIEFSVSQHNYWIALFGDRSDVGTIVFMIRSSELDPRVFITI